MMNDPLLDSALVKRLGLLPEEYARIVEILGRTPTYTELGIYSVMWSEHCSYKNSISVLKTLPRSGRGLLVSAGEENAGLVDIGGGLAVAFKIESHNHPSAVEPYQGAATGVGGILRDIFTMGARPIAVLNSLRFGDPSESRVRYLIKGVVKGIGDYGNSFGVPTIGGEVYFDDCYRENPIVNAMAVGVVEVDKIAKAAAHGVGNAVMIVGSSTGRDGIHGATFASEEISEQSEKKRPSVQVGDPFTEKLLLEATLEAISSNLVSGIQDMGAAGLTCSTSEMAARAKVGMSIDLDKVPVREEGMTPYEIMLSESQERMLVVANRGRENEIRDLFARWDLEAVQIGEVTNTGRLAVVKNAKQVADVPVYDLVLGGGAPVYQRESKEPEYVKERQKLDVGALPVPGNLERCLLDIISSPNISSKRWIYEQYDSMVRTNTLSGIVDAGIVRIKGTQKALALTTDGNSRYVLLNPRRGGMIAVAESARNVVCAGAVPIAITNCLNFGNPYKPELYWQFKEAVAGISLACQALETPVTGGNVSFYNESPNGAINPTPVIGMLGLVEDLRHVTTCDFKNEGDVVLLIGRRKGHVGATEYLRTVHNLIMGEVPELDLELEKNVQRACMTMIKAGIVKSAHDVSEGGLAITLIESSISGQNPLGVRVSAPGAPRPDFYLFGEDQSCIVISVGSDDVRRAIDIGTKYDAPVQIIGEVHGQRFVVEGMLDVELDELKEAYQEGLSRRMEEGVET